MFELEIAHVAEALALERGTHLRLGHRGLVGTVVAGIGLRGAGIAGLLGDGGAGGRQRQRQQRDADVGDMTLLHRSRSWVG